MGESIYRAGVVLEGDYKNLNVYKNNESSFVIMKNDENGKIIVKSLFPTHYSVVKTVSKETVERYEDISSAKQGPKAEAVSKGLFWLGPVGGLLGATASQNTSHDIALYFKDGKKSLVRILDASAYQDLKRILFTF